MMMNMMSVSKLKFFVSKLKFWLYYAIIWCINIYYDIYWIIINYINDNDDNNNDDDKQDVGIKVEFFCIKVEILARLCYNMIY